MSIVRRLGNLPCDQQIGHAIRWYQHLSRLEPVPPLQEFDTHYGTRRMLPNPRSDAETGKSDARDRIANAVA